MQARDSLLQHEAMTNHTTTEATCECGLTVRTVATLTPAEHTAVHRAQAQAQAAAK